MNETPVQSSGAEWLAATIPERYRGISPLLWFAVLLLNVASFLTTWFGLRMVFSEGAFVSTELMPALVAISIALLLVYFGLEIAVHSKGRLGRLVGAYALIASVSMFFNFAFIYATFAAADLERDSYGAAQRGVLRILDAYSEAVSKRLGLSALAAKVEQDRTDRDFEAARPDRPGKRALWIAAQQKYLEDSTTLSHLTTEHARMMAEIAPLRAMLEKPKQFAGFDEAHEARRALGLTAASIVPKLEAEGVAVPDSLAIQLNEDEDRRKLAPTVKAVRNVLSALEADSTPSSSRYQFLLSVVLSVMIDALPFVAVMLGRKSSDSRKRPGVGSGLWEPLS